MNKGFLWLGLTCIAIALFCIAALATASETTISAIVVSEGAGYDAGAGLQAEWLKRWDRFGLDLSGDLLAQKKHSADSGYREPPRKPRMLASGMNWQNKFK